MLAHCLPSSCVSTKPISRARLLTGATPSTEISQDLLGDADTASIAERVARLRTVSQDLETKMNSANQIKVDLERLANDMRSASSSYENEMEKAKAGISNDLNSVRTRREQYEGMYRKVAEVRQGLPTDPLLVAIRPVTERQF
ncbi:hypothetical protein GY45DRAFT_1315349 [Cubamyces sp. BRFM 1775]|nr:hypothetical protein GY45DRAFT_1315349 [Cubamyces sp. BRFM 1775]